MSEEILKVALAELLKTVRLRRKNGTIIEASGIEAIRDCCDELRTGDQNAGQSLFDFFNLAARITEKSFPIQVEFAVTMTSKE